MDLKERLAKWRKKEAKLDRPPGQFEKPPGEFGAQAAPNRPPGNFDMPPGNWDMPAAAPTPAGGDFISRYHEQSRRLNRARSMCSMRSDVDGHVDGHVDGGGQKRKSGRWREREGQPDAGHQASAGSAYGGLGGGRDCSAQAIAAAPAAPAVAASSQSSAPWAPWRAKVSDALKAAPWASAGGAAPAAPAGEQQEESPHDEKSEGTEDTDYDPFDAATECGADGEGADGSVFGLGGLGSLPAFDPEELLRALDKVAPERAAEEDEDEGIFAALVAMLRAVGSEAPQGTAAPPPAPLAPPAPAPSAPSAAPAAPAAAAATAAAAAAASAPSAPRQDLLPTGSAASASSRSRSRASLPTAAAPAEPRLPTRPLQTEEEERATSRPRASASYEYNAASKRWEPSKEPTPAPKAAPKEEAKGYKARLCQSFVSWGDCAFGASCNFAHGEHELRDPVARAGGAAGGEPQHQDTVGPRLRPEKAPKSYVIAECEAEARADVARGYGSYPQALAVRLALRFEGRPADILDTMAEAGLPASKDQRSTVKAIMRLCHPDKCKHPEAKRAMQVLVPLLS